MMMFLGTVTALERLSARELEVLDLMADGRSNVAISRELYLAPKTVEAVCGRVFGKLDLLPSPEVNRRVLAARLLLDARRVDAG